MGRNRITYKEIETKLGLYMGSKLSPLMGFRNSIVETEKESRENMSS